MGKPGVVAELSRAAAVALCVAALGTAARAQEAAAPPDAIDTAANPPTAVPLPPPPEPAMPAAPAVPVAVPATADEPPAPLPLVVEADLDGLLLRAAIAAGLGRSLTTLSRAQADPVGPSSVLTVSVDPDAGISVINRERGVGTDILTAPVPGQQAETIESAAALAVTLVNRLAREQRAGLELEANPYLRKLPKAPPPRPVISPINPYYRVRRPGGTS
jgi:hypothetical protein